MHLVAKIGARLANLSRDVAHMLQELKNKVRLEKLDVVALGSKML